MYMLDSTEIEEASKNSVTDHANHSLTRNNRLAQDGDESMKLVKGWVDIHLSIETMTSRLGDS